jgi:hypothetical protein
MIRTKVILFAVVALLVPSAAAYAQHQHSMKGHASKTKMTDAQKIANAMSAAPAEISKNATIMDWPATEGGEPRQLRAGTNGWVCFPNTPGEFGAASANDPMCLDKEWQAWAQAWLTKGTPHPAGTGIAYMLSGDRGASNTDPFATGPTADNNWVVSPPHVMVLYPDLTMLDAFPTDPMQGGAWVMWKGTPYAHLMVPVSAKGKASMPPMSGAK